MKRILSISLLTVGSFLLPAADRAALQQPRTVYLLPMANGMDQYLANHLTREGFYQVVTDHAKANVVLADRLGSNFESRMEELYPPPAPPTPPAKPKPEPEKPTRARRATDPLESVMVELKGDQVPRTSSISRGRGNLFLVDIKTRELLWSAFMTPKSTAPQDLNRTADRLVSRLERDAKNWAKKAQQKP